MALMTLADWISLGAGIVLVGLALLGWTSWPGDSALPMQWGLNGKPTWFAPRWLAFSLVPATGLLVLAVTAYASHQAHDAGRRQLVIALVIVAIDVLHLSLARYYA